MELSDVLICRKPEKQAGPLVLDSPHSGHIYPPDFGHACPVDWLYQTEDSYVDALFEAAPGLGVPLLAAQFPRCYIDPNRAEDDVDPELLEDPWPEANPTLRTQMGLGLIRRVFKQNNPRPIYDRKLSHDDVKRRLERYYRPYHAALQALLDETHAVFGAVFHLNCHSMPGPSTGATRHATDIVLGDLDGESCDSSFTRFAARSLKDMGYRVAVNRPYKGVEIVRKFSAPKGGRHCLQIELSRRLYMNEKTCEKTEGFARLQRDMGRFVDQLIDFSLQNSIDLAAD